MQLLRSKRKLAGKSDMDKVAMELARRFALAREESGLTQEYLASVCGLTKGAISAIENGRNGIAGENVFLLADALGVSARWLMTGVADDGSERNGQPRCSEKVMRVALHLSALPEEKLDALSILLGIRL